MLFLIENNNILTPEQGGFLSNLGTNDTIGEFLLFILILTGGSYTMYYDTIDHTILFK